MEIIDIKNDGLEFRMEFSEKIPTSVLVDAANLKYGNVYCSVHDHSVTINVSSIAMEKMFSFDSIVENMLARTLHRAFKSTIDGIIGHMNETLEDTIPSEVYGNMKNVHMCESNEFVKFCIINTSSEILNIIITSFGSKIDSSISLNLIDGHANTVCITTRYDHIHNCVEDLEARTDIPGAEGLSRSFILEVFYDLKFADWRK